MNIIPYHENDRSGWIGNCHIWAPAHIKTPWWATHERMADTPAGRIVITDCCCCKMRADETVCQIVTGVPLPLGLFEEEYRERLWEQYFESYVVVECGPEFGCNVKPRRRSSRHLREWRYECC